MEPIMLPGPEGQDGAFLTRDHIQLAGGLTHITFAFDHDTPGIVNGVEVYTPKADDILMDGWFNIDTSFDGTLTACDFGTVVGGVAKGLYAYSTGPYSLTGAPDQDYGGMLVSSYMGTAGQQGGLAGDRVLPATFKEDNPIMVWVGQNANVGSSPGATVGAATLHLILMSTVD